jgi:hypothetical protein
VILIIDNRQDAAGTGIPKGQGPDRIRRQGHFRFEDSRSIQSNDAL